METLLKNQDPTDQNKDASRQDSTSAYVANTIASSIQQGVPSTGDYLGSSEKAPVSFSESISPGPDAFQGNGSANAHSAEGEFPWEMIGLGLDEPLPPQDVMNDL